MGIGGESDDRVGRRRKCMEAYLRQKPFLLNPVKILRITKPFKTGAFAPHATSVEIQHLQGLGRTGESNAR